MKKIIFAISLLLIVIVVGTLGYMLIQNWNFFDSLYMTIITIGTVGFHEVNDLNMAGRLFTIIIIVVGIGIGGYAIANVSAFIIEGHIQYVLRGRKMEKKIEKLKNHIIVCGYGKTGIEILDELKNYQKHFVIIENDEQKAKELADHGNLVLIGDATDEETLKKAGVDQADGLISSLGNDADNVYIVLTSRGLNPKLRIIARAIDEKSSKKLLRAGADKVVSPYSIAGRRMARLLLTPGIVDFLDIVIQSSELELKIEAVELHKSSSLISKQLKESNIKSETDGAMIIGIKEDDKEIKVNPPGEIVLKHGHILYALGNSKQIEKLQQLAG